MEIEKAFKRLLIKNPFYGLFCMSLPKVVTTSVPTLCVTKQGINYQLNINPEFWNKFTDDEQLSLLQHELGHICLQHMLMYDSFSDPKYFNISADCEVNSYIENLPKNACTPSWLSHKIGKHLTGGMGTKAYYEAIQDYLNKQKQQQQAQNPQKPCNGGLGGNDSSQNSPSEKEQEQQSSPTPSTAGEEEEKQDSPSKEAEKEEKKEKTPSSSSQESNQEEENNESQYPEELQEELNSFDDHSTWKDFKNLPEATKQLMQNNINTILKNTAEQVEKMHGTIPGEFEELIKKLREKKPEVFNWKAYFRRLLGTIYDINIRSTRRKESKRFSGSAGIIHKKKVSILVAIDTSGSVSQDELKEFFSEIDYVYKAGARVTILQCDTRINSIEDYDGKNIPTIKGRGGTSFNPPVDYYIEHKKDYATLIYFTDGEAPLPYKNPSGIVWVISSNGMHQDYPGKAIYIPKNNN